MNRTWEYSRQTPRTILLPHVVVEGSSLGLLGCSPLGDEDLGGGRGGRTFTATPRVVGIRLRITFHPLLLIPSLLVLLGVIWLYLITLKRRKRSRKEKITIKIEYTDVVSNSLSIEHPVLQYRLCLNNRS